MIEKTQAFMLESLPGACTKELENTGKILRTRRKTPIFSDTGLSITRERGVQS
jgi:hypothetical protein